MNGGQRIVVTGAGVVSAAGNGLAALARSFARGHGTLRPIRAFDSSGLRMSHAGEVRDFDPLAALPPVRVRTLDRGSQMALVAARQALAAARPGAAGRTVPAEQLGVVIGLSGAQQYQNLPLTADSRYPVSRRSALYFSRATPAFQADLLARELGLGGPRIAFASASLASLLALAQAAELLRQRHAAALLVGGGEIQTLLNALGMDALGLGADGPCQPWGERDGMSFGEGAGFVLLERLADAEQRGAEPLLELLGAGFHNDTHHTLRSDPSGRGLAQAMHDALARGGVAPGEIAWVRGSGTGQRAQDHAERHALDQCFGATLPPLASTEPWFGHVNGVSPVLGLIAGLAGHAHGAAPAAPRTQDPTPIPGTAPTLQSAAPGAAPTAAAPTACAPTADPLSAPPAHPVVAGPPALPAGPLPAGDWLLQALAFGGGNGALLLGPVRAERRLPAEAAASAVDIVGAGAVSAAGCGVTALLAALGRPEAPPPGPRRVDDSRFAAPPGLDLQGRERLTRWCLAAVHEALAEAGLRVAGRRSSARLGLLSGLCRSPMAPFERFVQQVVGTHFDAHAGRDLLRAGRFLVASEVARAFGVHAYCASVSPGVGGGVQLLAQGAELLRAQPGLDALVVLAADEWTPLAEQLYGCLAGGRAVVGGEGAAALVLARREPASPPAPLGRLAGCALGGRLAPSQGAGQAMAGVARRALARAGLQAPSLALSAGASVHGGTAGPGSFDGEAAAAAGLLQHGLPWLDSTRCTGHLESAGGLFAAIAAAARLASHPTPPGAAGRHALLCGATERGALAAAVLSLDPVPEPTEA